MKYFHFILSATITFVLVYIFNVQLPLAGNKTPKLGMFLHPQQGFWKNAEPVNKSFNETLSLKGVNANAEVYFDDRLVPHIYAQTSNDAYFVQGYLHAKFRLFQMEFQTHVAGGRLSEIVGTKGLSIDRYFRRLGMTFGAENALEFMQQDIEMKKSLDAYTAGVNSYLATLKEHDFPLEYKILNYKPEPWTNLKTCLFLKFMSYDLSGGGDDIMYQNAKTFLGYEDFNKLFPNRQDTLDPIIPKGTVFEKPSVNIKMPWNFDSGYLKSIDTFITDRPFIPNKNNGSNNWAVDSSKTKSKKAILCNDPHLGLNLPSLWYEVQITTPEYSTYGASFPGSPAVIIGFNDSIAWGVTNSGRDVKDYYELKFKDSSMKEYLFDGNWKAAEMRTEKIKVRDSADVVEQIAITDFGLVMYDKKYQAKNESQKYYSVRWTAHDASNELMTFIKLNKSKNYSDYRDAISTFECPGQNFVFASQRGDVAITQQGKFIAKWDRQGDFVMPGIDSTFMWQGFIPFHENPTMHAPARGFVSSANQQSVDSAYKYYLGRVGNFPPYRGYIINQKLKAMSSVTVDDMKTLQTDNFNVFAKLAMPVLLGNLNRNELSNNEVNVLETVSNWNFNNDAKENGATIFKLWWDSVEHYIYDDNFWMSKWINYMPWPEESVLLETMQRDSNYRFYDNFFTDDKKENLSDCITESFKQAAKKYRELLANKKASWGMYKDTYVKHLLNIPYLNKMNINMGGGTHCINATSSNHGPSWRMIVHLTEEVEAYGIYPGGQNGNPGSKYYNNFIDSWAKGDYYKLLFIKKEGIEKNKNIKWKMSFVALK